MKLYVVTADGWLTGYGTNIYLVGAFDNLEAAEKAQSHAKEKGAYCKIHEINLNEEHPLRKNNPFNEVEVGNDFYLGGYCE